MDDTTATVGVLRCEEPSDRDSHPSSPPSAVGNPDEDDESVASDLTAATDVSAVVAAAEAGIPAHNAPPTPSPFPPNPFSGGGGGAGIALLGVGPYYSECGRKIKNWDYNLLPPWSKAIIFKSIEGAGVTDKLGRPRSGANTYVCPLCCETFGGRKFNYTRHLRKYHFDRREGCYFALQPPVFVNLRPDKVYYVTRALRERVGRSGLMLIDRLAAGVVGHEGSRAIRLPDGPLRDRDPLQLDLCPDHSWVEIPSQAKKGDRRLWGGTPLPDMIAPRNRRRKRPPPAAPGIKSDIGGGVVAPGLKFECPDIKQERQDDDDIFDSSHADWHHFHHHQWPLPLPPPPSLPTPPFFNPADHYFFTSTPAPHRDGGFDEGGPFALAPVSAAPPAVYLQQTDGAASAWVSSSAASDSAYGGSQVLQQQDEPQQNQQQSDKLLEYLLPAQGDDQQQQQQQQSEEAGQDEQWVREQQLQEQWLQEQLFQDLQPEQQQQPNQQEGPQKPEIADEKKEGDDPDSVDAQPIKEEGEEPQALVEIRVLNEQCCCSKRRQRQQQQQQQNKDHNNNGGNGESVDFVSLMEMLLADPRIEAINLLVREDPPST